MRERSPSIGAAGTATRLLNGKVLIAGGQSGDSSLDSAELYDPLTGVFSPTGSMSDRRSYHTATLLTDGRVLIAGGHRFNHPASAIATAELYDPATGAFTPTASMSIARQDHTATRLPDGRVLIAGGYDQGQIGLASAEIYDPSAGTFTPTGTMSSGRGNHTATLLGGGKVLITGGHAGFPGGSLASAELFNPATGASAPTGSMNEARGAQSATLLADGTVLIAGGFTAFPSWDRRSPAQRSMTREQGTSRSLRACTLQGDAMLRRRFRPATCWSRAEWASAAAVEWSAPKCSP